MIQYMVEYYSTDVLNMNTYLHNNTFDNIVTLYIYLLKVLTSVPRGPRQSAQAVTCWTGGTQPDCQCQSVLYIV